MLRNIEAAGYQVWPASSPMAWRIGGLSRHAVGRTRDAAGHYIADGSLSSTLRAMGQLGNKHLPEAYMVASAPQRLALLQGLMDSDGYVDVYGRCEFVNIREELSNAVAELAASLGLRPVVRKKRDNAERYRLRPLLPGQVHPTAAGVPARSQAGPPEDRLAAARPPRHRRRTSDPLRARPLHRGRRGRRDVPRRRTLHPNPQQFLGRLGLLTHSTAGFIDAGFSGHVTLELSNVATLPIKLWPGMKIGQLCFFRLTSPAEAPYGSGAQGSRYQGQRGPTPSRSFQNFHRTRT